MTEPDSRTKRAGVTRDNAFRDLAITLHKVMSPILSLTKGKLLSPPDMGGAPNTVEVLLPYAPAQVHDLIRNLQVAQKQLEIALVVMVDQLASAGHIHLAAFLEESAKKAEETEKLMHRGLLSAGVMGSQSGAIIRPS